MNNLLTYPTIPEFPEDWTWDELHLWESMIFGQDHVDSFAALGLILEHRNGGSDG